MARIGITKEDVIQAANVLVAEGKSPTVLNVRKTLGNTGSNTTINKHLSEWKNFKLAQDIESPGLLSMPDAHTTDLAWLNQETKKTFLAIEKQCVAKIQSLFSQQEVLTQKIIQLEKDNATLHSELKGAESHSDEAKHMALDLQALKIELAEAKHQVKFYQQQTEGNNHSGGNQAELKTMMAMMQKEQKQMQQMLNQVLKQQSGDSTVTVNVAEEQAWLEEINELERDNQQLLEAIEVMKRDKQRLESELLEAKGESKHLKDSLDMFRDKLLELDII